ncbi:hypothetical protein SJAG_00348 [Schizosaccharomyces japonicus yFS275]|uniref:Uncharacterized protein n=1 Tax=Schizosaccharomyces japonicus (strain yFS275 / FY16936) TaxID=402676 RepID=B6JVE0_SCHJY|nr:hypothetical protein SJAG_00348 [Schizosaccharomyces japonicus yFS275]EEB05341.1 hypothetical protein SJAG_00348 [Schizosaccharomyces japonicus yFS275]
MKIANSSRLDTTSLLASDSLWRYVLGLLYLFSSGVSLSAFTAKYIIRPRWFQMMAVCSYMQKHGLGGFTSLQNILNIQQQGLQAANHRLQEIRTNRQRCQDQLSRLRKAAEEHGRTSANQVSLSTSVQALKDVVNMECSSFTRQREPFSSSDDNQLQFCSELRRLQKTPMSTV